MFRVLLQDEINGVYTQSTRAKNMEKRRTFLKRFHLALNANPAAVSSLNQFGGFGAPANASSSTRAATGIPPALAHLFPTPSPSSLVPAFATAEADRKRRAQLLAEAETCVNASTATESDRKESESKLVALVSAALSSKRLTDVVAAIEVLRRRVRFDEKSNPPAAASQQPVAAASGDDNKSPAPDAGAASPTAAAAPNVLNLSALTDKLYELSDEDPSQQPVRYGGATSYVQKSTLGRKQPGESMWKDDTSTGQLRQVASYYGSHVIALNSDGLVYVWGDNTKYQCGVPHSPPQILNPTLLTNPFISGREK